MIVIWSWVSWYTNISKFSNNEHVDDALNDVDSRILKYKLGVTHTIKHLHLRGRRIDGKTLERIFDSLVKNISIEDLSFTGIVFENLLY
jgi:hypothetical protein